MRELGKDASLRTRTERAVWTGIVPYNEVDYQRMNTELDRIHHHSAFHILLYLCFCFSTHVGTHIRLQPTIVFL